MDRVRWDVIDDARGMSPSAVWGAGANIIRVHQVVVPDMDKLAEAVKHAARADGDVFTESYATENGRPTFSGRSCSRHWICQRGNRCRRWGSQAHRFAQG
jgi:hypothetical protein